MSYHTTIEEAIENGDQFYCDQDELNNGRSGGTRCPKCRKWITPTRKRKDAHATWLDDCDSCEIKDPFKRMWHGFNRQCDEDERKIHNDWLREVRLVSGELNGFDQAKAKIDLQKLIMKIPFFEGV